MINLQEEIGEVLDKGFPCAACGGTMIISFIMKNGELKECLVCKQCGDVWE